MLGCVLVLIASALPWAVAAAAASTPSVTAASAIVIDADTGAVLYERNAEDARPIASLTKLFTAWSAVQIAAPARMMTVEPSDLVGEASMGLIAGERLSFNALLHGMLLASGNDAAAVVGRELGGVAGTAGFMQQVNADAHALGLTDTTLVNPHGLDAPGHVSTARDVATLALALHQQHPELEELLGSVSWTGSGHSLINTNTLVGTVPGVIAGKTGVTPAAGTCLLEVVQRNGRTLIVVTLGSTAQSAVSDAVTLIDDGFRRLAGMLPVGNMNTSADTSSDAGTQPATGGIASASGASVSDVAAGAGAGAGGGAGTGAGPAILSQQVGGGTNPQAGASRWVWIGVALLALAITASGFGLSPRRRTRRVERAQPHLRLRSTPVPQLVRIVSPSQASNPNPNLPAWHDGRAPHASPVYATAQMGAVVAHAYTASAADGHAVHKHTQRDDSFVPPRSQRGTPVRQMRASATAQGGSAVPPTPLPVGLLAGTPDAPTSARMTRPLVARTNAARKQAARSHSHLRQATGTLPQASATSRPATTAAPGQVHAQVERRQTLSDSFAEWTRDLPVLARVPATSGD